MRRTIYLPFSILFASLTLCFTLALMGCNNPQTASDGGNKTDTSAEGGKKFRVALVLSGLSSDNGWNAGAFNGLQEIAKELNLSKDDYAYVDNQTAAGDQEKSLRGFASKKYDMVIGHGNEYEESALKMESEFPKTMFIISSGRKVGTNTSPIVFLLEDGAYLQGMLAAGMSKTNVIGSVGAVEIPPLKSIFAAFEKGAKAVNPNIKVIPPTYTNSWDDPNKAKAATIALMEQNADIIMQNVDAASQGVFNAVQEKAKSGKRVFTLGTNKDQNAIAPDVILASAPIYNEKAFVLIAKQIKDGTFKPNDQPFDMKSGVIDFLLNPTLEAQIPADLKKKITAAQEQIIAGTLKTN